MSYQTWLPSYRSRNVVPDASAAHACCFEVDPPAANPTPRVAANDESRGAVEQPDLPFDRARKEND